MAKNLLLGTTLAPLAQIWAQKNFFVDLPVLDVRHCCKLSLYAISKKTNEPNLRKWQKNQFWVQFWHIQPKFGPPIFFSKIWLSVARCYGHLSSCTISKQTNNPILRKLSDGRTDRLVDGTDRGTRVISQHAVRPTSSVQKCICDKF